MALVNRSRSAGPKNGTLTCALVISVPLLVVEGRSANIGEIDEPRAPLSRVAVRAGPDYIAAFGRSTSAFLSSVAANKNGGKLLQSLERLRTCTTKI